MHGIKKTTGKKMQMVCDPAGTRTQDPYIKSVLLYQLSYRILAKYKQINSLVFAPGHLFFGSAKIREKGIPPKLLKNHEVRLYVLEREEWLVEVFGC